MMAALTPMADAHEHDHATEAPTAAQLGVVAFETSCKAQVQADFNRGIALLHSFWHEEAKRTFDTVAAADPDCAMAYWGQAMASFHLFSSTPTGADLEAGRQELARAAAARETSPREAGYIRALRVLFDGYEPTDDSVHERRFAEAMRVLSAAYPKDVDATAFYALALLASAPPGDVELTNSRKAVAATSPLFRKHPDHPGLIHYLIHASDNPHMAQQGLGAARRYAAIAPAAPHALHMPSHIFARLGLWPEDIRSNLASKAAAENTSRGHIGAENRLHAMEFLQYAYLQTGQYDEAHAILTEARTIKSSETNYTDYYRTVEARYATLLAIETRDWSMAASLEPVADAHWYSEAHTLLAHAVAAGHLHDAQAGRATVARLEHLTAKIPSIPTGTSSANLRDEIRAWAAYSSGDAESAFELLRPLADLQAKVGKGEVELPAREMLAEIYLLDGKPLEALTEYELSLRSDPNRFNGLLGAARAAKQLQRPAVAARYYRQLAVSSPHATGAARALRSDE
jgi:tetratricopeptide (TPR) repeat protein